jgi:hypothetical protein
MQFSGELDVGSSAGHIVKDLVSKTSGTLFSSFGPKVFRLPPIKVMVWCSGYVTAGAVQNGPDYSGIYTV